MICITVGGGANILVTGKAEGHIIVDVAAVVGGVAVIVKIGDNGAMLEIIDGVAGGTGLLNKIFFGRHKNV